MAAQGPWGAVYVKLINLECVLDDTSGEVHMHFSPVLYFSGQPSPISSRKMAWYTRILSNMVARGPDIAMISPIRSPNSISPDRETNGTETRRISLMRYQDHVPSWSTSLKSHFLDLEPPFLTKFPYFKPFSGSKWRLYVPKNTNHGTRRRFTSLEVSRPQSKMISFT